MNTNRHESEQGGEILLKDEVYRIVGCAFEVMKVPGHGLNEKPYESALVVPTGSEEKSAGPSIAGFTNKLKFVDSC